MTEQQANSEAQRAINFLASVPRYGNTTVPTKVYRAMLLATDGWIMAAGCQWDIKGKSLGAGVYRVTLEKRV